MTKSIFWKNFIWEWDFINVTEWNTLSTLTASIREYSSSKTLIFVETSYGIEMKNPTKNLTIWKTELINLGVKEEMKLPFLKLQERSFMTYLEDIRLSLLIRNTQKE